MSLVIRSFFDPVTSTFTHVVHTSGQAQCAVVDAVLGYDPVTRLTDTQMADQVKAYIQTSGLQLQWLLETHVHADHLSAASYLRAELGGRIGISGRVMEVRCTLADRYGPFQQRPYDHLFATDEVFYIGPLRTQALAVPGHTPADIAYLVNDEVVFVGDTLFPPDVGTARCDFPGGSAKILYRSIQRLLSLPAHVRMMMCHDYPPHHRALIAECTVAQQREGNIHIRDGISEAAFLAMRTERDGKLSAPRLLEPSMRANLGSEQPERY
jgi:glyoxylase-like metal-dependent hydrolase (beta-lactamase superfamily II)